MKRHFARLLVPLAAAVVSAGSAGIASAGLLVVGLPSGVTTGTTLMNTITGPGIAFSNVNSIGEPSGVTYIGADFQGGTFSGGLSAGLGIDTGIILTTGYAPGAHGPNDDDGYNVDLGAPGDAQLTGHFSVDTHDANVLEFDFTTTTGDVFLNFVFASEEYNENVASYNDMFAFFLDNVNIALIPNSLMQVSINTVNQGFNGIYYRNNDRSDFVNPPYDIEYDGMTTVFTALGLGLAPGPHHAKFAIADARDGAYDSAVFIQAGAFRSVDSIVPEPCSLALLGMGLVSLGVYAARRKPPDRTLLVFGGEIVP